jgi:hypothetical protein
MTKTPILTGIAMLCVLVVVPAEPTEDTLELNDGSRLSGRVLAIEGSDKVVVDSSLSDEHIHLRAQSLSSISFRNDAANSQKAPQLLHLVNGDILPGTLQNLDSKEVSFLTGYANELTIPRDHVHSIDFGVTPQKLVYSGPKPITEWSDNDDWEWENGSLTCNTSGTIAAENVLPRQFILRFRLDWENDPNFRIYFCDDFLKRTGNADRYYFEVNSMGSQLKRQTTEGGRRWHTLAQSHQKPREYPGRGIDVELRVNRDSRQIYLYLNSEKIQRTPDPIDTFPTGTGIMLQSQAGGDLKNIVSKLEIYEWDAVTELRRDEGHEDPKTDGLVDVEGQHLSGSALQLQASDQGDSIIFESPFNDQPLNIQTSRISALYFKHPLQLPEGQAPVALSLTGGGSLQCTALEMKDSSIEATHPLLGKLTLDRNTLKRLAIEAPQKNGS